MTVVLWTTFILITCIIHFHVGSCFMNFALNKSASQSSTLNYKDFQWTADKAVDGNTSGENPDASKTCSATNNYLGNHTWEVDIGFLIIVKTITVYTRNDTDDQHSGFKVFIGNTTRSWTGNQPFTEIQTTNTKYRFRSNDSLARFVSVIRENKEIMTICEVIVDGECPKGKFGDVCNETCGHCLYGNVSCNSSTGQCTEGCQNGWSGEKCKEECPKGTFGDACNETCGHCLYGNVSCNSTTGQCTEGCQNGWSGERCKEEIQQSPSPSENGIITIGVVVPVVMVIILVIIVLAILRVRRKLSGLCNVTPSLPNRVQMWFHRVIQKGESSDPTTQEMEDTILNEGNVYQNTEIKKQLMTQIIPVLAFWGHVTKMKANKEQFELEFQELSQGLTKAHEKALENPSKNRYQSIIPYDFNRVVLKRDSVNHSVYENDLDYINASHIKGFESRKSYIAAQGPITEAISDFWWMVWQERTECIVMLTNVSEMGQLRGELITIVWRDNDDNVYDDLVRFDPSENNNMKCIQYWPDKGEQRYGDVTVKFLGNESFADCIRRDLQIDVDGKSRKVTQFHYIAWPDKDVPDTAWSLVEFWKSVRKYYVNGKVPMTVHCSAGVGRTGTFIALDIIYDEACETGNVDVMKCVENLREQRVNMVQTVNQFIFLHDAVAESLGFGTMPVFNKQFPDVLRYLMEEDEMSGLTRLERQYNMLRQLNMEEEESNMPVYSNDDDVQSEIIWLPNLSGRDAYIAMKQVDDETLLATIRKRNVKWLIMVDSGRPEDVLVSIGVNDTRTIAGLDITCQKKEDLGVFERIQFSITSDERTKPQKLIMFLLKTWEESNEVPSDPYSVLSLFEDFSQHHPSPSELNPVLLYSRWELNRCSLIYILLNEKDRIRRDGEIHVLRTSAEMFGRSRALLPTFKLYDFMYKCLLADALQDFTYENTGLIMREIL